MTLEEFADKIASQNDNEFYLSAHGYDDKWEIAVEFLDHYEFEYDSDLPTHGDFSPELQTMRPQMREMLDELAAKIGEQVAKKKNMKMYCAWKRESYEKWQKLQTEADRSWHDEVDF